MEKLRSVLVWLTLLLASTLVTGEYSVSLKFSDRQTYTSSTLKWVSASPGNIPENVVVGSVEYVLPEGITEQDLLRNSSLRSAIQERKIYVCRANVNGNRIPGALIEKSSGKSTCVVSLVTKVYHQDKFEVLQNVDRAARLLWKDWEKNTHVPHGTVISDDQSIAHSTSPNFKVLDENLALGTSFLMGKIDMNLGLFGKMSVVTEDDKVLFDISSGQVLVEMEPVMYELTISQLNTLRRKIISRNHSIILGETTLRNDDDAEMKADSVITYSWKYISNWGPGRAMLKGLSTTIIPLNSSSVENITWGLPFEEERNGVEKVESILPAGTATHVQVIGDYLEVEVPYTATLLSVFQDSNTMNRTVHGTWRYTTLVDVKTNYGPLYFIQTMMLVPTTTTTTTEPPPSTTTPSTTSMTNEIIKTTINEAKPEEKRTTFPTKEDMQSDQSAMQLKKKDEPEKPPGSSATPCFSSSSFALHLSLVSLVFGYIVNRIT